MRAIRGVVNGILMVTLMKPIVRLMVGRWRKQVQASPAATIGLPVQELLEAALIEELAMSTTAMEAPLIEEVEPLDDGRSVRSMLFVALAITVATAAAVLIARAIRERRAQAAKAGSPDVVAVPIEVDEDVTEEVFA